MINKSILKEFIRSRPNRFRMIINYKSGKRYSQYINIVSMDDIEQFPTLLRNRYSIDYIQLIDPLRKTHVAYIQIRLHPTRFRWKTYNGLFIDLNNQLIYDPISN